MDRKLPQHRHRTIPAGEFKQKCLSILDEVAETHEPLVVSKRGRLVARVVPLEDDREIEVRILTQLRSGGGRVTVDLETFLEPTESIAGWGS